MEELLAQSNTSNAQKQRAGFHELSQLLLLLPEQPRRLLILAIIIFIVSSFVLLAQLNDRFLIEVPRHGGELSEGIIGRPRFINPVIAKSDADRDMTQLIYSGLLRKTPDGELTPDLASQFVISDDGLTYTFTLRDNLVWHDGVALTSDDVAFTIDKVRDHGLAIKSPHRASWEGVTVETPDPRTIIFRIKQPYVPFLESTTLGIIPKHIWNNIPNEEFDVSYYNIKPIGSGPYKVESVTQDSNTGLPQYYDLSSFADYAKGEPYITKLRIAFFGNNTELSQAYTDHTIDQMLTIEPALAESIEKTGAHIDRAPLPRIFALYFNQNQQPIFAEKAVRKALDAAIDKEGIVQKVLLGYGRTIDSPLPFLSSTDEERVATSTEEERITNARNILEKAGWVPNALGIQEKTDKKKKTATTLEFSIAIPDVPVLRDAAEMVKSDWEKIGARVSIRVFESSSFTTEVLSPRKYDVLFYGQILGRTPDPFPYWHSSQRNAPGLNVALYINKNVDKLLEDARKERDDVRRKEMLSKFVSEIQSDTPAIFIYSPDFLYATSGAVRGIHTGLIITESERFLGIENWYIQSEHVWKWFSHRMIRPN